MAATAQMLGDGKRFHLNHGPIDLIIEATGNHRQVQLAYACATRRFATVLDELVSELPLLRTELPSQGLLMRGIIAQEMQRVARPHWAMRLTSMAAVAGAVADEILRVMVDAANLRRAYVNNGGDIALHLQDGESFSVASPAGPIVISSADPVRGIATSGWRGRSFSLGIADSVTVLAACAAEADVAATLIANAVDLPGSSKITRQAANLLSPDSDLRDRLVTVDVAALDQAETHRALAAGARFADVMLAKQYIVGTSLLLCRQSRYVGHYRQVDNGTGEFALSA